MKSAGTSTLLYFYKPRKLPRIWGAVTPQLFKPERTHCPSNSPFSQSCTVTKSEKFWQATGQSNYWQRQLAATKASKVWFSYFTQLHFGQWSSLPFCLPSLIVQWSARTFHFYLVYSESDICGVYNVEGCFILY